MTGRTIVFYTCFGVWSEKLAIIPLGSLAIPFRRVIHKSELFLSLFFQMIAVNYHWQRDFFCLDFFTEHLQDML